MVHCAGWAGHPLSLLASRVHCTEPSCPPWHHPTLPKPISHHCHGPQWVTLVCAVWAFPEDRDNPMEGEESLCVLHSPWLPPGVNSFCWASKQGAWHRALTHQGAVWDGQAHGQAPLKTSQPPPEASLLTASGHLEEGGLTQVTDLPGWWGLTSCQSDPNLSLVPSSVNRVNKMNNALSNNAYTDCYKLFNYLRESLF